MRLSLRRASGDDAFRIADIYAPYVKNTTVSFEYAPPDAAEMRARFLRISAEFPFLVCEADGKVAGYAYADRPFEREAYRWCAELSVYVDGKFCRRGIGGRLVGAVEEICRRLGYRKMYALVTGENENSLAFHGALGYSVSARFRGQGYKFGRTLDVYWLEKELGGDGVYTRFPRPASALSDEEWRAICGREE